jgi:hypothetical protein
MGKLEPEQPAGMALPLNCRPNPLQDILYGLSGLTLLSSVLLFCCGLLVDLSSYLSTHRRSPFPPHSERAPEAYGWESDERTVSAIPLLPSSYRQT